MSGHNDIFLQYVYISQPLKCQLLSMLSPGQYDFGFISILVVSECNCVFAVCTNYAEMSSVFEH